jgi:hypothetical protein
VPIRRPSHHHKRRKHSARHRGVWIAMTLRYLQHAPESHFAQDAALVAESLSGARDAESLAAAELLRLGIRPA